MTSLPQLDGPAVPPLSGGKPKQLIVLLHGLRSNGDDLIGLVPQWQSLLPDALWVSPHAWQAVPDTPGGYQWWEVQTFALDERRAGAAAAGPVLDNFIDQQLDRHGLEDKDVVLIGFSQGTVMALHVAPRREKPIAGVLGYSGMVADPRGLGAELKCKPEVMLVHGDRDPMLPLGPCFHFTVGCMEALQFPMEAHIRPGLQHGIDPGGIQLGAGFLKRVLGA